MPYTSARLSWDAIWNSAVRYEEAQGSSRVESPQVDVLVHSPSEEPTSTASHVSEEGSR